MFNKVSIETNKKSGSELNQFQFEIFDLTTPISEKTAVFPGDPKFKTDKISSLENGQTFNLCHMHLGNHTGAHIDFPGHVLKNGKLSDDYSIQHLIGSGLIIEVPEEEKSISKKFISQQPIKKNDIVFFKTANSNLSKQDKFIENYVFIEPDTADELVKIGVKIVGIDYISVDAYDAGDLIVHRTLLSNEILIVEGLELKNVPIGRYEIFIMPLNIANMDGLPVRVIAFKNI